MPFIHRDKEGKIVSMSKEESEGSEYLANVDSELVNFMSDSLSEDNPLKYLLKSDLDLTRVLEDLIELLVGKGVIRFTDLPGSAQHKLIERRQARAKLREEKRDGLLLNDDEILRL
jgi:hypothetical protein